MAHHFSEHASQAVSRESEAALIPLEKHATLAQPLSQNTPKSARNSTGADTGIGFAIHRSFRVGIGDSSLDGEEHGDDMYWCFYYTTLHTSSQLDFVHFQLNNRQPKITAQA
jgi:hypothetical protein